jgi:hypothetical protein
VKLESNNHGCATCHASNLWDAQGMPTHDVWMGLGSSSIHLARYSSEVYVALQHAAREPTAVVAMLDRIYPTIDPVERKTLVELMLPAIAKRIAFPGAPEQPVPFDNGGPGLTNSVGHLKSHFGILDLATAKNEVAFTQIPEFSALELRNQLLCDGVYSPKGHAATGPRARGAGDRSEHLKRLGDIATLFTISTLGVAPARAHENWSAVHDVMAMVSTMDSPPFPGAVDVVQATRGLAVWETRCQQCHGEVSLQDHRARLQTFPNRIVAVDVIGTDAARMSAADNSVLGFLNTVKVGSKIDAAHSGGYVAPALTAVWATAPYLHNGSVPTLWHLMHPEQRPARFQQGGHALDFGMVGIAGELDDAGTWRYPATYTPWMDPEVYDATTAGRTRVGHDQPFMSMTEVEKADVLELMKAM